jgi:phosphatidylinositol alpha 1,6-mannosyltransferase
MDVAGAAVLEAQASGVPVVVPDAGEAMEQIVAGRTGFLSRVGQVDDIVACIARLLRNAGLRADMGRSGRVHGLERDWPAMLRPLHAAWRAAGRRRGAGAAVRASLSTNEAA